MNGILRFKAKIYCGKLYLPSRVRRMMGLGNGDLVLITMFRRKMHVEKACSADTADGWIFRRKARYSEGFKYCGHCQLFMKPVGGTEFLRCPICHKLLKSKPRK